MANLGVFSLGVVLYEWYDFLSSGRVVVVVLWLLCYSAAAVGGRRVVACCVSEALVVCWCLHSECLVLRTTIQVYVSVH